MKTVDIFKAQPFGDKRSDDCAIQFIAPMPDTVDYKQLTAMFEAQAMAIEETLINTLPGGTYDQLLRLMLTRKASLFVVRHG